MSLTVSQIEAARELGGGALLRKYDQLEGRIASGKAGKGEAAELEKMEQRIADLASRSLGKETKVSPVEAKETIVTEKETIVNSEKAKTKLKMLERLDNLKAFGREGRMIEKMWSKRLNKMVAVISRPEQRSLIKDPDVTIYTIEETIMLSDPEIESDPELHKAVDQVKGIFDAEIVGFFDSPQKAVA